MMRKKIVALALSGFMLVSSVMPVSAAEVAEPLETIEQTEAEAAFSVEEEPVDTEIVYGVGPAYQSEYSEEDIRVFLESGTEEDEAAAHTASTAAFNTQSEAAAYLKQILKSRTTSFSFTLEYTGSDVWKQLMEEALKENSSTPADEGDYIKANLIGYGYSTMVSGGQITYKGSLTFAATAEQEAQVTNMLADTMASLGLDGKSDADKVRIIHDYIVERIEYTNDGTLECHSTYAALVKGKAVCQGYASLLQRMCKEAGIASRYITGYGNNGGHAWNILKLGNVWYNIDATWDDPVGGSLSHDYFLKSEMDFTDHARDEEYKTSEFYKNHPMADTSYGEKPLEGLNANNLSVNFNGVNGGTLSTASEGRPKILIFFSTACGNSMNTLSGFSASNWITKGAVDVYAIDCNEHTREEVAAFEKEYCPEGYIRFGYDTGSTANSALWQYAGMAGFGSRITYPIIVMIDSNNKVQYCTSGVLSEQKMNKVYLPLLIPGWVPVEDAILVPVSYVFIREYPDLQYIDTDFYDDWVNGKKVNLKQGERLYLKGIAGPSWATNTSVKAEVSDERVMVYDASTGVLNVIGAGTATLTFTSVSNPEISAYCTITVEGESGGEDSGDDGSEDSGEDGGEDSGDDGKATFSDVPYNPGSWKYDNVQYVYENGIMNGIAGTDRFEPDSPLTRAMFATVLYRMAGQPAIAFDNPFSDVEADRYYSNAVIWAYRNKIVSGYEDGSYGVDNRITREQIAKMLCEYGKIKGYDVSARASLDSYTDKADVNGWAEEYMQWAVSAGMISGKPNGNGTFRLDPKGEATRAECAKMLTMFSKKYAGK